MTALCFKTRNITSFYRNIVFSCFESKSSTIGNNKRDNGKLVMLSSLNKFHFEAVFFKLTSLSFFFPEQRNRPENKDDKKAPCSNLGLFQKYACNW